MRNSYPRRSLAVALLMLGLIAAVSCKPQPTPEVVPPTAVTTLSPTTVPSLPAQQTPVPTSPVAPTPGSPAQTPGQQTDAAALVNNEPVSLQEYEAQVALAVSALSDQQTFDPQTTEGQAALLQLRRQILDSMIDQTLIEQAAAREGVEVPMEKVEAEMNRLIGDDPAKFDDWLKANDMTRESFKAQLQHQLVSAAFQEHIVGSSAPEVEQVHARHILVATEAEAIDVLVKLRAGESFVTLAQQYSQDRATRDQGGDLGFFPRGIMPVELEQVAFALDPGQVSGIVKSDFGYHIIEVLEKDPQRPVSEEMLTAWRQNKFLGWLEEQRATAKIVYLVPVQ